MPELPSIAMLLDMYQVVSISWSFDTPQPDSNLDWAAASISFIAALDRRDPTGE
jgi:hypothetical protein